MWVPKDASSEHPQYYNYLVLLGEEMEVQILCTKMIKPSTPTPPHLRTLKLSPFNRLITFKVPIVFYYPSQSGTGMEEVQRRKDRLEKSLSETLNRFYPLAGKYVEDENWVDCNDEGVECFEARVKGSLRELLSRRDEMIPHLHQLAGGEFTSSLFSVQINEFDCGGLVIGIRFSHRLCDGFSAINFIDSWATGSRQGLNEVISPYFEVSSVLPENDSPMLKSLPPRARIGNTVTRRLVIDEAKISSLKARAHDPIFKREATRVEVVTAVIWRALMGVSRAKHGRLRTSLAIHAMNLRPNIVPPLPPLCVGNIYTQVIARFKADNSNTELPELKDLLGLLMDAFTKSKQTIVAREDVMSSNIKIHNEIFEIIGNGEVDVLRMSSWCRLPFYEADFGWGKPGWVSYVHMPVKGAMLLDTEDGNGIEVWMGLTEQDMPKFLQDEYCLALISKEARCS